MGQRVYPDKLPSPVAILGWDGTDFRVILVDTDHHTQVDILESVLPDDAATQTTLAAILTELGQKLETGDLNIEAVTKDLQVDVLSSALPSGASTETTLASLLAGQAPLGRDRTFRTLWDTVVGAGATQVVEAEHDGSGYVTDVMFRAKGADNACNASYVRITIDGTHTAIFLLQEMMYLNNGAVLGFADIECFKWDTTTHEFWVHWKVKIPFLETIQIDVINGDGTNVCTMRVGVVIQFDVP